LNAETRILEQDVFGTGEPRPSEI